MPEMSEAQKVPKWAPGERGFTVTMTPVKSSNIAAIGHHEATNTLAVKFTNGGVYHYPGVSRADHDKLMAAKSVGSHYAQHIRPHFKGEKQNEAPR